MPGTAAASGGTVKLRSTAYFVSISRGAATSAIPSDLQLGQHDRYGGHQAGQLASREAQPAEPGRQPLPSPTRRMITSAQLSPPGGGGRTCPSVPGPPPAPGSRVRPVLFRHDQLRTHQAFALHGDGVAVAPQDNIGPVDLAWHL